MLTTPLSSHAQYGLLKLPARGRFCLKQFRPFGLISEDTHPRTITHPGISPGRDYKALFWLAVLSLFNSALWPLLRHSDQDFDGLGDTEHLLGRLLVGRHRTGDDVGADLLPVLGEDHPVVHLHRRASRAVDGGVELRNCSASWCEPRTLVL